MYLLEYIIQGPKLFKYYWRLLGFVVFVVMVFTVNIKKLGMIDDEQALTLICVF